MLTFSIVFVFGFLAHTLYAEQVEHSPHIALKGYGEILYSHFDFGPDQKSNPQGSAPDNRAIIDVTRLVIEMEVELYEDLELEAEIEFEHGGTGAALELEYEEFGEFETEVEKGGEVIVEELYVRREFGEHLEVRLGHFYLAVGLLSQLHMPTDHYGTRRGEGETTIIPAVWHESGVEIAGRLGDWRYQVQLVNGLDATGFSSQGWVAGGHQKRFEQVRADNMALVGRLDYAVADGLIIGASAYSGDSADNRPKPDLKGMSARVSIFDVHGYLNWGRLRARGLLLYGTLENAALVSARNRMLSNNLEVLRSPVAKAAHAFYTEIGYDVLPLLGERSGERLDFFFRYDDYDTMSNGPENAFDNPRFARKVYTFGTNYTLGGVAVLKADYAMRRLGTSVLNGENTFGLGIGFQF